MNKMHGIALAGAAAMMLAACGGGDDSPAPAPVVITTEVPASAQQDAAGLAVYANQQVGTVNDTGEPILVGDATLPVDDTTETSL